MEVTSAARVLREPLLRGASMSNKKQKSQRVPDVGSGTYASTTVLSAVAANPHPGLENDRLEYAQVCDNLRAGVTVLWDAFKTYFTVTALLFAGFAFLYSDACPLEGRTGAWASVAFAAAGIFINVLASLGIWRILAYQKRFLGRGETLESRLGSVSGEAPDRVLSQAYAEWKKGRFGAPALTVVVFAIFMLPWIFAAWHSAHLPNFALRHESKPIAVNIRR